MKLPPLVVAILVVVAALILLYLVARLVKPFGHSLGFVATVAGRFFVSLAYHMQRASSYCGSAMDKALESINDGAWTVGDFLRRLIGFTIGFLILAGESILVVEVLPSLFQAASVSLPPIFELSSAALFICCSALFGDIVLECWGKVRGVGLFHQMGKPSRWIVGSLAMLMLLFSCVVNFYFYIYRGEILAHQQVEGMAIYLMGGLGLEVSAAAPVALLAVKEGAPAVVALLFWFVEKSCEAMHAFATFIPDFLDILALHLSGGQVGVWGKQIERDPHKYPVFFGYSDSPVDVVEVPSEDAQVTQPVQPKLLPEKVSIDAMKQPFKTAAIVFVHTFGSRLFFVVKTAIELLGAAESILDTGLCDLSVGHINTALPAIIDDSPSSDEKKAAIVHTGTQAAAYETLTARLAAKLVEVHLHTKAAPAPLVFVIDKQCLSACVPMLQEVKRRLPLHSVVVVTSIVQADLQNEQIVHGLKAMQALHRDEVVEKIIVLDARSPFALSHGEETQLSFAANACVSLLLTHKHNLNNMSGNELLKMVRPGGAFASFAFASEGLALGRVPTRLSFLPGLKEKTGMGEIGDMLLQSQAAIKRCVQDATCATFPAPVDSGLPAVVLLDVPVKVSDSRFAEVVSSTSRFVNSTFPFATSVVVSGNGCTYPTDVSSHFNVQASLLFGLPSLLPEEPQEEDESGARVFTLVPLPTKHTPEPATTGNGNGHTNGKVTASRKSSRGRKSANGK